MQQFEIELDINAIAREAIKECIKEKLVIHDVSAGVKIGETIPEVTANPATSDLEESKEKAADIEWEFAPRPGRRRSKEEIALHELELKYGRLLTPEEKGETKAAVVIEETAEEKAKQAALKKNRIDGIVEEGMTAASEELAKEAETSAEDTEKEETIPKADELNTLDSMFK